MDKGKEDLRKLAENSILMDDSILYDDKVEMLDEDTNVDILTEDWDFIDNLQNDGYDVDLKDSTLKNTDDPGISGW